MDEEKKVKKEEKKEIKAEVKAKKEVSPLASKIAELEAYMKENDPVKVQMGSTAQAVYAEKKSMLDFLKNLK